MRELPKKVAKMVGKMLRRWYCRSVRRKRRDQMESTKRLRLKVPLCVKVEKRERVCVGRWG